MCRVGTKADIFPSTFFYVYIYINFIFVYTIENGVYELFFFLNSLFVKLFHLLQYLFSVNC